MFKAKNNTLAVRMWQRVTPPTCGVWYCPDDRGQGMWLVNGSPHCMRGDRIRYRAFLALFTYLGYPIDMPDYFEAVAQTVLPNLLSLEIRFKSDHTLGNMFRTTVRDLYDERSYLNDVDE